MPVREVEIIVRGSPGSGAYSAARAVARALEDGGVSVDLQVPAIGDDVLDGMLRGLRASVQVEDALNSPIRNSRNSNVAKGADGRIGIAQLAKIGIGVVLLLIMFGAEINLRFGLTADMFVTVIGLGIFYNRCIKRDETSAPAQQG